MANHASGVSSVDDLRLAVALADRGSVLAAAASLHIAQPSASQRLRLLERRLGVQLFIRGSTGTRPTPAGAEYVRRAREALSVIQHAADDARRRAGTPVFRAGTFTSLSVPVFTAIEALLSGKAQIEHRIMNGGHLLRLLDEGALDAAVVTAPQAITAPAGVQIARLGNDPLLLVAPAGVELPTPGRSAPPYRVCLASYSSQPDDVAHGLAGLGAEPRIVGSAPVALAIARANRSLAAVPRTAWSSAGRADDRVSRLPAAFDIGLALVTLRDGLLNGRTDDLGRALGLD